MENYPESDDPKASSGRKAKTCYGYLLYSNFRLPNYHCFGISFTHKHAPNEIVWKSQEEVRKLTHHNLNVKIVEDFVFSYFGRTVYLDDKPWLITPPFLHRDQDPTLKELPICSGFPVVTQAYESSLTSFVDGRKKYSGAEVFTLCVEILMIVNTSPFSGYLKTKWIPNNTATGLRSALDATRKTLRKGW